jgi:hypothetical protein
MRRIGALVLMVGALIGCSRTDTVTVPNLHDECVVEAYQQLEDLGMKVEIDGPFAVASNYCPGVEGHAPEAGSKVDAGSVVKLHPGFGLHGLPVVSEAEPVALPDLIGMRLDIAVSKLESLGLLWTTRRLPPLPASDARTLLENYSVTKMEPDAGETHDQFTRRGNVTTTKAVALWATPAG